MHIDSYLVAYVGAAIVDVRKLIIIWILCICVLHIIWDWSVVCSLLPNGYMFYCLADILWLLDLMTQGQVLFVYI